MKIRSLLLIPALVAMATPARAASLPSPSFGAVAVTAEYGLSAAGLNQAGATAISRQFQIHQFSTVGVGAGAVLPPCDTATGRPNAAEHRVFNDGTNQLFVYPSAGQAIGDLGVNAPAVVDNQGAQTFTCKSPGQWVLEPLIVGVNPIVVYRCGPATCLKLDPSTTLPNPLSNLGSLTTPFTPQLGFATSNDATTTATTVTNPGTLTNDSWWWKMDRLVCMRVNLVGKLNYTTGTGAIRLLNLPVKADPAGTVNGKLFVSSMTGISYPTNSLGNPYISIVPNNTYGQLTTMRSLTTTAATAFTNANIANGTDFSLTFDGCYVGG